MPLYHYEAVDPMGQRQHGSLEAPNLQAATSLLMARALYVVRLEDAVPASGLLSFDVGTWWHARQSVTMAQRILFYKQLGMMLRSGLTLLQALDASSQSVSSPRLRLITNGLRHGIEGGASLSEAMSREPQVFDHLIVELVRGAEASGDLESVMERVAHDLERKADLQRQLITSLIYPCIVVLTAVGVSLFLVLGVVPKFAEFFAKSGRPLPPATQNLIDLTAFLQTWGPWLGLCLGIAALVLAWLWQQPHIRPEIDRKLLHLPVIGHTLTIGNMARFAWTAAMLTRSGVTIIETLQVARSVINNAAIAADIQQAAQSVLAGQTLAASLQRPSLPPLVSQLASVGEQTGALDTVLQDLGDFYQKQLESAIKRMTALIEPVLILLVAAMVGYVYYAFFSALFAAAG